MAIKMDHTGAGDITLDTTQAGELRVDGVALGFGSSDVDVLNDLSNVSTGTDTSQLLRFDGANWGDTYTSASQYMTYSGALLELANPRGTTSFRLRNTSDANYFMDFEWDNAGVGFFRIIPTVAGSLQTDDAIWYTNAASWKFVTIPKVGNSDYPIVPTGGTSGQVLAKSSANDHHTGWVDGGATTLDGLTDVDLTGAADNDMLYRSGGNWVDSGGALQFTGSALIVQSDTSRVQHRYDSTASSRAINLWSNWDGVSAYEDVVRVLSSVGTGDAADWSLQSYNGASWSSRFLINPDAGTNQGRLDFIQGFETSASIHANDGTVSIPTYSFKNDPDTGMYSGGADLSFAVDGSQMVSITDATTTGLLSWNGSNLSVNRNANSSSAITVGETTTARGTAQDSYIRHYGEKSGSVISYGQLLYDGTNYQLTTSDKVGDMQINGIDLRIRTGGHLIINTDDDATSALTIAPPGTTGGNTLITATGIIEFDDATQFDAAVDINSTLDVSGVLTSTGGVDITASGLEITQNGSHIILNANAVAAGRNVFQVNNWDNVSAYEFLFRMITTAETGDAAALQFQTHNGSSWSTRITFDGDAATNREQMLFPQGFTSNAQSDFDSSLHMITAARLHIWDSSDTDDVEIYHNGTNLIINAVAGTTSNVAVTNVAAAFQLQDGCELRVFDSTDTDYVAIDHSGTNGRIYCIGGDLDIGVSGTAAVTLRYANVEVFRTVDEDGDTHGTAAQIRHADQVFYPVGMNVSVVKGNPGSFSAAATWLDYSGHTLVKTNTTAFTATTPGSTDSVLPNGVLYNFLNVGGANDITIAAGSGVTLTWQDGAGGQTGSRTIADGGVATLWKRSDTNWYIWGNGIS